jgi:enamine deaminase RidA (YjgF/YER057c/UK114 family)
MINRTTRAALGAAPFAIAMAFVLLHSGQVPAAQPGTTKQIQGIEHVYQDFGVSAAVKAGDLLFLGGITALDGEGKAIGPYDGKKQFQVVYARIAELLKAHGADAKNVVSETAYVTGWQFMAQGAEVRRAFYDDAEAAYPNATGVEVVSLAVPELVVEIEVIAYLGD